MAEITIPDNIPPETLEMLELNPKRRFKLTKKHLELCYEYPHLIAHMAGRDKFTHLHGDWIRYGWDTVDEYRAIRAHRGSLKTTSLGVIGPVRRWLSHPDDRIVAVRKTHTDSADMGETIKQTINKPLIQELYYVAHGQYPKTTVNRYGQFRYNFKKTTSSEGNFTASGIDGKTGLHFDRGYFDDFITLKDRTSKAERVRTKEQIREWQANILDPGCPALYSGTVWHRDDAWTDGVPCTPLDFPASRLLELGLCVMSEEEIQKKKKLTTPFLYSINYELSLDADDGALFQNPNYGAWDYLAPGAVGQLDAAFDGDHYCALTIMAKRRFGPGYQAKGWAYPGNVKDWAQQIAQYYKTHRLTRIYIETNADKGYTADLLRTYGCVVVDYSESMNKHIKISTYLYQAWSDLWWADDVDPEYMNIILDYREGQEPDDPPDSAASLWREAFDRRTLNSALFSET